MTRNRYAPVDPDRPLYLNGKEVFKVRPERFQGGAAIIIRIPEDVPYYKNVRPVGYELTYYYDLDTGMFSGNDPSDPESDNFYVLTNDPYPDVSDRVVDGNLLV